MCFFLAHLELITWCRVDSSRLGSAEAALGSGRINWDYPQLYRTWQLIVIFSMLTFTLANGNQLSLDSFGAWIWFMIETGPNQLDSMQRNAKMNNWGIDAHFPLRGLYNWWIKYHRMNKLEINHCNGVRLGNLHRLLRMKRFIPHRTALLYPFHLELLQW